MKNKSIPFYSYLASEPYIYVSYAKEDFEEIYDELISLYNLGYRIWYDEDIENTAVMDKDSSSAIEKCTIFIFLVSKNSGKSKQVRRQVNYCLDIEKPILTLYLNEYDLPRSLLLGMAYTKKIHKQNNSTQDYIYMIKNEIPKECVDRQQKKIDAGNADSALLPTFTFLKEAYDNLVKAYNPHLYKDSKEASKKAYSMYLQLANRGHLEAQHMLGMTLFAGIAMPKDRDEGYKWIERAAMSGYPESQTEWGQYYVDLEHKNRHERVDNLKKAFDLFQKAADQGYEHAIYKLAECYHVNEFSDVAKKDYKMAAELYYKASQLGSTKANERLYGSRNFARYLDVEKTDKVKELILKANAGDSDAQMELCIKYHYGDGVIKDEKEGHKWCKAAAENGHIDAMYNLGAEYNLGIGVKKDQLKAMEWVKKAADRGHRLANKLLRIWEEEKNEY